MSAVVQKRAYYTVDYDPSSGADHDTGRLRGWEHSAKVFFRPGDGRAALFESFADEPLIRLSDDRRQMSFSFTGYVGPVNAFDLHRQIGEVVVTGTVSCPEPIDLVVETYAIPKYD